MPRSLEPSRFGKRRLLGAGRRAARRLLAATSVTAVALVAFAVPAVAAEGTAPVLRYAHSVAGDPGILAVSAQSDSDITQITAHLYRADAPAGSPEIAEVDTFTLQSGTAADGEWRTPEPLQLADKVSYRVTVDLTDVDGDHTQADSSTTFNYWQTITIEDFQVTPAHLDFGHQQVTVSGLVTVEDPGTRESTPAVDQRVVISTSSPDSPQTSTGSDGRFSTTFTPTSTPITVSADVPDLNGYGQLPEVQVDATAYDTRVQLDTTDIRILEGQPAHISGVAQMNVDGVWQPLPDTTVAAVYSRDNGHGAIRPTTDADGRFSGDLAVDESSTVEVSVASQVPDIFLNPSPVADVHVTVVLQAWITDFTATLAADRTLSVSGLLWATSAQPGDPQIAIQYSPDGETNWSTIGTVVAGAGDPGEGGVFTGTFSHNWDGYYRAFFQGNESWQSSYSDVVHVAPQ